MTDCEARAILKDDVTLTCDLWYGHWPKSPHLDRMLSLHWFRTQEIPGDLVAEDPRGRGEVIEMAGESSE